MKTLVLVLAALLFLPVPAISLLLPFPGDLDDLTQALRDGEIDQSLYELLLDNYDFSQLSWHDLVAVGAVEPQEGLPPTESTSTSTLYDKILERPRSEMGVRHYARRWQPSQTGYYFCFTGQEILVCAEAKRREGATRFGKRSVQYEPSDLQVKLGNYLIDEGCGLTIGRFDYRPTAGESQYNYSNFWSPINDYYNGLALVLDDSVRHVAGYFSYKQYGKAHKKFVGFSSDLRCRGGRFGFLVAYNRLAQSSGVYQMSAWGVHVDQPLPSGYLRGESSWLNGSFGQFVGIGGRLGGLLLSGGAWYYSAGFKHYNCTGPAASDYRSFYPAADGLGFRSAQAGETGVALNCRAGKFQWGGQLWRQLPKSEVEGLLVGGLQLPIRSFYHLGARARWGALTASQRSWVEVWLQQSRWVGPKRLGAMLYFDRRSHFMVKRGYAFLSFLARLKKVIDLRFELRTFFSGQLRCFLLQKAVLPGAISASFEVVMQAGPRVNVAVERSF